MVGSQNKISLVLNRNYIALKVWILVREREGIDDGKWFKMQTWMNDWLHSCLLYLSCVTYFLL